jgi:hypothetical protein
MQLLYQFYSFAIQSVKLVLVGLKCLAPFSTIFQLYIVVVSFIGGGTGVPEENYRPVSSH